MKEIREAACSSESYIARKGRIMTERMTKKENEPNRGIAEGRQMENSDDEARHQTVDTFGDMGTHVKDMADELGHHTKSIAREVGMHTQHAVGDVSEHVQSMPAEIARHSQQAVDDIRREVPVLIDHVKDTMADLFNKSAK